MIRLTLIALALTTVACASTRMRHPPLMCRPAAHKQPIPLLGPYHELILKPYPHCRRA